MLLGEVNLDPEQLIDFFGGDDADEVQLLFNFPLMEATWLSLARQDAGPIAAALRETIAVSMDCQYANFLRNHDELTLDKLSEDERQEVFDAFGPEEDMQVFGRGLRRRLPPMLDGDPQRIRMAYSLMFSMPGTPVLFYGEEIGMGENLAIEGRTSVRTPMQWTDEENGGVLEDAAFTAPATGRRRPVRPACDQRRGPTPRSGLAAQLDGAADPATAGDPRARVGHVGRGEDEHLERVRPSMRLGGPNRRCRT
jgi:glycosidase